MKSQRFFSLWLVLTLLLGLLTGCGADNTPGSIPDSTPENPMAATLLSAEEDARLKEELQKDIDAILNTKTEIVHSDTYIPGETYTGTAYYVSADGDDDNDGLTPETAWKTVAKVGRESMEGGILQFGDAVFFRRGDLFRSFDYDPGTTPFTCRTDGITYSAYGEGEKPVITGSPENGTGAEKWELVYEDETGVKIWRFHQDLTDIATIVCDDKVVANRVYEWCASESVGEGSDYVSCELKGWWMHEDVGVELLGELLPLEKTLPENMTFVSRPARWPADEFMNSSATGPLYLRCDTGNPGELFHSIEFSGFEVKGLISMEANDIVFDNLSLRYTGTSYIKNEPSWKAHQNTVIQNCEFAYGGGSVSFYRITDSSAQIVEAQGDGIYCIVRNATIRNNYIHDSYASAVTFEAANVEVPEIAETYGYFHLLDNVIIDSMGVRLDSSVDEELQHLDSVIVRGNQVWNTGTTAHGKYYYPEGSLILFENYYGECVVEDNVIYGEQNGVPAYDTLLTMGTYTDGDVGYTQPQFINNIYAQYSGGKFASFVSHGAESWYIDDEDVVKKAADLLGDTTSKFYIIP